MGRKFRLCTKKHASRSGKVIHPRLSSSSSSSDVSLMSESTQEIPTDQLSTTHDSEKDSTGDKTPSPGTERVPVASLRSNVVLPSSSWSIVKALKTVFPNTVQLQCFIHMKDNILRKLSDFLLPQSVREDILQDIFGKQRGTVYVKGLVDSYDAMILTKDYQALKRSGITLKVLVILISFFSGS